MVTFLQPSAASALIVMGRNSKRTHVWRKGLRRNFDEYH